MKNKKAKILLPIAAVLLALAIAAALFLAGIIRLNTPNTAEYPVWGVDVSEYQGNIDWPVLESQNVQFAFIKATEGSGYVDPLFQTNWDGASQTGTLSGAYHFFSFESAGKTQAENFMGAVANENGRLPPVVDIELYGTFKQNPPEAQQVRAELDNLLRLLEEHYGQTPILYTTNRAYALYLEGHYPNNPLWIRDVYFTPNLQDGIQWVFWQYSDKGRLTGYDGEEQYIDLNVFHGSLSELNAMAEKNATSA